MNYLTFLLPFTRSRKYKFEAGTVACNDFKTEQESYDYYNASDEYAAAAAETYKTESYDDQNEEVIDERTEEMYYENEEVIGEDNMIDDNIENIEEPQSTISVSSTEIQDNSADWYFLKSLMPDIQLMNSAQKRKLRIQILTVIDNILSN